MFVLFTWAGYESMFLMSMWVKQWEFCNSSSSSSSLLLLLLFFYFSFLQISKDILPKQHKAVGIQRGLKTTLTVPQRLWLPVFCIQITVILPAQSLLLLSHSPLSVGAIKTKLSERRSYRKRWQTSKAEAQQIHFTGTGLDQQASQCWFCSNFYQRRSTNSATSCWIARSDCSETLKDKLFDMHPIRWQNSGSGLSCLCVTPAPG